MKMYGIPNCDTVKKAKKFLETNNVDYDFVDFKKVSPTKSFLSKCKKELGEDPVNKRGTTFRKLKDDWDKSSSDQKIQILIENSSAIKRPILEFDDGKLLIGFDEKVWSQSIS